MTMKGSLHGASPIVKLFSAVKNVPKWRFFGNKRVLNVKFLFSNPEKAHPCAEPRRLVYFGWKSVQGPGLWAVGRTRKKKPSKHFWCEISCIREKKPLEWSWLNYARR